MYPKSHAEVFPTQDDDDDDEEEIKVPGKTGRWVDGKWVEKVAPPQEELKAGTSVSATMVVAKPGHVQKQISEKEMKEKLARKEKKAKLKADSKRVHKYFKGQIKAWEALLMARPDDVKRFLLALPLPLSVLMLFLFLYILHVSHHLGEC
jgi:hypothetical protein